MRAPARTLLLGPLLLLCAVAAGCAPGTPPAAHPEHAHHAAAAAPGTPEEVVKQCRARRQAARQGCYQEALLATLRSAGPGRAVELLDRLAALDTEVKRDGHMYAHTVGISAYTTPEKVGETFAACTPGYQSGCYHGVVQAYFADVQRRSPEGITAQTVNALCGDYRGEDGNPWLLFQCSHGMGHGLLIYHAGHLPRALTSCDLVHGPAEREGCYGGAFMENIVSVTHPQHPGAALGHGGGHGAHAHHGGAAQTSGPAFKPLDRDDLLYPCSVVEEKYWAGCYSIQTAAILYHTGHDVARAARACEEAPERMRKNCHVSLGRDVGGMALQEHDASVRLCSQVGAAAQPWCHVGVVRNLVNFAARAEDGMAYCRVVPGEESKTECYRAVAGSLGALGYDTARREEVCRGAEAPYVAVCRAEAGLSARGG